MEVLETPPAERAEVFRAASPTSLRRIARSLKQNRRAVAQCLMDSIADWEKFAPIIKNRGPERFLTRESLPLTDYLIHYFASGDRVWRDLYIGDRLRQLHWLEDSQEEMLARQRRVMTADRNALVHLLSQGLPKEDAALFAGRMDAMLGLVFSGAESHREVSVLFVGDCLFFDVCTFLAVPLLELGLTLRPIYATSKNPVELRSFLRRQKDEKFDLICYSPYSYEFNLLLAQTHSAIGILTRRAKLRRLATEAHNQTASTLRLLAAEFDCSIVVHNTANVRRHSGPLESYLKNFATLPGRRFAAKEVNLLLAREVAEMNTAATKPFLSLDELALVEKYGEFSLGKKFYSTSPVHPAEMGLRLVELYREIIPAAKLLLGRKLIVLDLDNTLWHGVIGEGSVVNDHRRQKVLKQLRRKGVLLAIASKNDPTNVHWTDATLQQEDFVASEINWDAKAVSIKRIAEELNLKAKDFVFIDDRPDEREMVQMSVPGIHCLDATEEATWRMLDWWAAALPAQIEGDRTQLYAERKARQSHIDEAAEKEGQTKLFTSLRLRVELFPAGQKDLARAAELINRTNQFNTGGSRVTTQQVAAWSGSPDHFILMAEAADRFGGMGIISVLVAERVGGVLTIPVWVLSCRVFGFGIESAMLRYVCQSAESLGAEVVRGTIVETPNNQPCREVYATNGFTLKEPGWELPANASPAVPTWLTVSAVDVERPVLR